MSGEDVRLAYAAAQNPPGPSPSEAAHADREARLAADEAQLRLPPAEQPHGQEILSHHQGMPTVETQLKTHGAPARAGRGQARLVELHPLDPLGLQQHDPVSAGWYGR
jgi:hypothetical protein